jgi:hypothetical protein
MVMIIMSNDGEDFSFEQLSISEDDYLKTFSLYQHACERVICSVSGGGIRDYCINDDAFADAMKAIEQDINIIMFRRKIHKNGISDGKVAGIYAFRLSRSPVVSFCPASGNHQPHDKQVNTVIALVVALGCVDLTLKNFHRHTVKELVYAMLKRHMNQETIALVIDASVNKNGT